MAVTENERLRNHVRDLETRVALTEVKCDEMRKELDILYKALTTESAVNAVSEKFDNTDTKETPNGQ